MRDEDEFDSASAGDKRLDTLQVVSFHLGKEEYAIEIRKTKEIILVEGVTKVPQMPEFIEGIINLRGNVIPVLDLRKRFGLSAEKGEQNRIVVCRMDGRIMGLIVDSVSQVMKIPTRNIQPPPETIAGFAGEYLNGVGKVDSRMILLLDVDKVLEIREERALRKMGPEKQGPSGDWSPAGESKAPAEGIKQELKKELQTEEKES